MPSRASANDLLRFRLAGQLISPAVSDLGGVVRHFLAMQAQDFGQAVWALGARVPDSTRADVVALLDSGAVIRSWPMRGTLHFVEPGDIRWMLRLTSARTIRAAAKRRTDLGLDDRDLVRAADLVVDALQGGRALDRAGVLRVFDEGGVPTDGQRGVHIINHLAQTALVCWGPTSGAQQALVLLDEWVPPASDLSADESLREFVWRYIRSHGPATLKDFVWWSKLTVGEARTGFELAGEWMSELAFDGDTYFVDPSVADRASARVPAGVVALPAFDEYLLGYQNRSHSLAIEHAQKVVPGNSGVFLAMIVSRGRIVGVWKRSIGPKSVVVTGIPFEPLTSREVAGFEREAARYGRFQGLPVTVKWA